MSDLAVDEVKVAFGAGGDAVVVGDEDHCDLCFLAEFFEEVEDFGAGFAVKVSRGFVGEEDLGLGDESASEGDPLLLSTREFIGAVLESIAEADAFEEGLGFVEGFESGDVIEEEWESGVFSGG